MPRWLTATVNVTRSHFWTYEIFPFTHFSSSSIPFSSFTLFFLLSFLNFISFFYIYIYIPCYKSSSKFYENRALVIDKVFFFLRASTRFFFFTIHNNSFTFNFRYMERISFFFLLFSTIVSTHLVQLLYNRLIYTSRDTIVII